MRRPHRRAHATIWALLALVIPGLLIAGFALRQDLEAQREPVRLAPPSGEEGDAP